MDKPKGNSKAACCKKVSDKISIAYFDGNNEEQIDIITINQTRVKLRATSNLINELEEIKNEIATGFPHLVV